MVPLSLAAVLSHSRASPIVVDFPLSVRPLTEINMLKQRNIEDGPRVQARLLGHSQGTTPSAPRP